MDSLSRILGFHCLDRLAKLAPRGRFLVGGLSNE